MATQPSSQTIARSQRAAKQLPALSPRWMGFLAGWFFGWPILIVAYNPLAAPYDPLTLLLVIPGGAIWLLSFAFGCAALIAMAESRWPATTKTILRILSVALGMLWIILWCIP